MSEGQFAFDIAVKIAAALFTLSAVVAALFGPWLRDKLMPPLLKLSLVDPKGHLTDVNISQGGAAKVDTKARWYHLKVRNDARGYSPATHVQVFLLRIDKPNAAGEFHPVWSGEIPMLWRGLHNQADLSPRSVGRDIESDLIGMFRDVGLWLRPLVAPSPLDQFVIWPSACKFRLALQAKGAEADSNILVIDVIWNGEWDDDTEKMARNLIVREASPSTQDRKAYP